MRFRSSYANCSIHLLFLCALLHFVQMYDNLKYLKRELLMVYLVIRMAIQCAQWEYIAADML